MTFNKILFPSNFYSLENKVQANTQSNEVKTGSLNATKVTALPKCDTVPRWVCTALLIAAIVITSAIFAFGIAVAALVLADLGLVVCGYGGIGVAFSALGLHLNLEESRRLAIRKEMSVDREAALKTLQKNPDLLTAEVFFEYMHPKALTNDEKEKLQEIFKKDSPKEWQRAIWASVASTNSDEKIKKDADDFFEQMEDRKFLLPKCCIHPEGTAQFLDRQDNLSQYLKAFWKIRNVKTAEDKKQVITLLYAAMNKGYSQARLAVVDMLFHGSQILGVKPNQKESFDILRYHGSYNSQALCLKAVLWSKIPREELDNYNQYLRAANQGSLNGIVNVIRCLRNGVGVTKDAAKAEAIEKEFGIDPSKVKPFWKRDPNGPVYYSASCKTNNN